MNRVDPGLLGAAVVTAVLVWSVGILFGFGMGRGGSVVSDCDSRCEATGGEVIVNNPCVCRDDEGHLYETAYTRKQPEGETYE